MAKLIFQNLNQIILMITISLLVFASESIAGDPCRRRFEQVSRSTSLHETAAGETIFEFEETALAQNIPLERVKWPMYFASPYCSVGKLLNDVNCTAFMISKNHALTAKHCAIKSRRPGGPFIEILPKEKLTLCLGRRCNTEGTCLTASHVEISDWADYALITYKEDHWCTHWLRYSDSWDDGSQIELIGYRKSTQNCQYDPLLHSVCSDTTGPHEYEKKLIYYNCESLPGMSGSPISVPCKSGVYGVHSIGDPVNGQGKAVLITKDRYCDIASCINTDNGNKNFGRSTCSSHHQNCKLN